MNQNPTIYKVDDTYDIITVLDGVSNHLIENNKQYNIKEIQINEYAAHLVVIESDEKPSEWSNFFPSEYLQDISLSYKIPSLLLLIETDSGIYAIIGGQFYQYILPFLNTSFGLNTYSRLMDPVHDQIVTIKTRGVTGLRAGMSEQFKDNYRIMDYIKFGKIPTELKIKLSDATVNLYFSNYVSNRSPYIILNISTGFNLNKNLTYIDLGNLIEIIEYIETLPANDFFSSYKEITDQDLIRESLKPALINKLFNDRSNIINNKISNYEICYPNKIEDFYSADEYKFRLKKDDHKFIQIGNTNDKSQILKQILTYLNDNNLDRSLDNFGHHIYNIYIYSYKAKSKRYQLKTALIYHLNTELYLSGLGTYIYLDSKWYKLRNVFIKEMNERSFEIINANNHSNSILDEPWTKKGNGKRQNESSYNGKYDKDNYLVLDAVTSDSIELADILHIENDTIYLCHVKWGFSTDMRALYNQIISSSRRLKNDLKDDDTPYLKDIYRKLQNKNRHRNYSELEFLNLFKSNNIKYIMGITGHIKNRSIPSKIERYDSNIAKLSLIQCFTEMRTEYYDLSFEIINNDACFS